MSNIDVLAIRARQKNLTESAALVGGMDKAPIWQAVQNDVIVLLEALESAQRINQDFAGHVLRLQGEARESASSRDHWKARAESLREATSNLEHIGQKMQAMIKVLNVADEYAKDASNDTMLPTVWQQQNGHIREIAVEITKILNGAIYESSTPK